MNCDIPTLVEDNTRNEIIFPWIDKSNFTAFVETGTYLGGNLIRCALRAKEQGKYIQFYAVDNFLFENVSCQHPENKDNNGTYFPSFWENVVKYGVEYYIIAIKQSSLDAYTYFTDNFIDFLFIDDNHSKEHIEKEVQLWLPKVRRGGIISGHDYPDPQVNTAINNTLKDYKINTTSCGSSFYLTI